MLRKMPACMRQCMPTSVFSSDVMVPKRRMFWNVRPMPSAVIWCCGSPAMSWPSNTISPAVGV